MDIQVLGGDGEIGGNKVLIEHKDTRILLDFGMSFSRVGTYFSEFLQPRKCSSLEDFFEFDLLPDIPGIYREDYLRYMGRGPEEKGVDALFLSHAHMDHAGYIHFLRKDIPIYCTEPTKVILQCIEETGRGAFSEFCTCCEAFTFYKTQRGKLAKVNKKKKEFVTKRTYTTEETVELVSLTVEMVPVDHSLPGACAFIVYSDEGNVVYSGDLRFRGLNGEKSDEFVKKAKKAEPKFFICEGTRINCKEDSEKESEEGSEEGSEEKVEKKIKGLIPEEGLVFVEHPKRDIDRIKTIYESANHNNREFVVDLKLAYLLENLGAMSPLHLEDLKILIPRKVWGLINKKDVLRDLIAENYETWGIEATDDLLKSLIEKDYITWERDFIFKENAITCEELKKNPGDYVVSTSFWEINQLTDVKPENAIWIKSKCEPFTEEMGLDEERKQNWLTHFGIKEFKAHASGHASESEIKKMIHDINPKDVIPIHTNCPDVLKGLSP